MPSLADVASAVIPAGTTFAQWLASRNSLNNATNTVQAGAQAAGTRLNTASSAAIAAQQTALAQQRDIAAGSTGRTGAATAAALQAQKDALAKQNELHDATVTANQPYSSFGTQSIKQLQDLQAHPDSLTSTPGYQFELSQGLQGGQRAAAAAGTLGNGGTVKAQTRYALDYASTKYQEAFNRLMQATGVGERANAANASANVTLGNQTAANANEVGDINRAGATADNTTMGTLGSEIGTNANNVGNIGTQNAENQAALTLAQAELAARNQSGQGVQTGTMIDTLGKLAPSILKAAGIGGTAAAAGGVGSTVAAPSIASIIGGTGGTAVGAGTSLGAVAGGAVPEIASSGIGMGASGVAAGLGGAAAPATGVTGALGLGGGAGLFGLGAATIPVVGGIIAGGALLANHFIGQGRKAADKLTGQGGIQHAFEDTLNTIDAQPGYTEAQKWQSKEQAYEKLKGLAQDFAKKGSKEKLVVQQMFNTISPLFGDSDPWKAAA